MTYNNIRVSECCTKIKTLADILNYRMREGKVDQLEIELDVLRGQAEEALKILRGDK
jgi:hypothetical protein